MQMKKTILSVMLACVAVVDAAAWHLGHHIRQPDCRRQANFVEASRYERLKTIRWNG